MLGRRIFVLKCRSQKSHKTVHSPGQVNRALDVIDIRYGFAVVRVCRPSICPQAGAGQRRLALTISSIFRVIASDPACSSAGPRLHSFGNNDIGILHVCPGVRFC